MKHATPSWKVGLLLLAAPLLPLAAQVSSQPAENDEESVVMLSPFVISEERDSGYAASNTLAGTRLKTPVQDLGAAISIYTKDLLQDLGATNSSSLMLYATGMEVGGVNGNFSSANLQNGFVGVDSVRDSPQFATRVRGLSRATTTRAYYITHIPFDTYNTSQVTVNRGPNSVLFGLGSPGGLVDHSLNQPSGRNKAETTFRFDSYGSARGTLDIDRVLVPGKLAIRINALYDDERYQQKPSKDFDRRLYASLHYTPFRGTALRASAETGLIRANRPYPMLPLDNITPWMDAGRPIWDFKYYDTSTARNANQASTGILLTPTPLNTYHVYYSDPSDPTNYYTGNSQIATGLQQAGLITPINQDGQAETYRFLMPPNYIDMGTNRIRQGFTPENAGIFDWKNRLYEGDASFQRAGFDTFNVALEQRSPGDRLGIELSYNWERFLQRRYNAFSGQWANNWRVDVNTTLSSGQPNPNLGRPYLLSYETLFRNARNERETLRATGFAKLDFEKDTRWAIGKWLGRHTLTALAEKYVSDAMTGNERQIMRGDSSTQLGASEQNGARAVNRVIYIGPSLLNATTLDGIRFQQLNMPIYTPGEVIDLTYWVPQTQSYHTSPHVVSRVLAAGSLSREEIESFGAILQSYWLRDHLVTVVGVRKDKASLFQNNAPPRIPNDPAMRYTYEGWVTPDDPTAVGEARLWTYSAVLKAPRNWLRAAPVLSDASLFFTKSSNFEAGVNRHDFAGNPLPPPEGETTEVGLNLSFMDKKFNLRWNYFETTAANATYNNLIRTAAQRLLFLIAGQWELDRNNGFDRSADIARLFQGVPENMKELFRYQVTENPNGVISVDSQIPAGLQDTATSFARGHEIEIVYNPTKNWRILLNVAKQDTVLSDIAPGARAFQAMMADNWAALADEPVNSKLNYIPGGSQPSVAQYVDQELTTPLRTLLAQTGTQALEQRRWRWNFVNNYSFTQGALKGWRVGGALRWQDKANIGYIITPQPDGSATVDVQNPRTAPAMLNGDAWIGYSRKIGKNIQWRVQLNVNNLIYDDEFIPVVVQPDTGAVAQYRIPHSRTWMITNTFSF